MRKTKQPTGKSNHACPQIISAHVDVINNAVGLSAEKTLKKKKRRQGKMLKRNKIIPVASSFSKRGNHHLKKFCEVIFNQDVTIPKPSSKRHALFTTRGKKICSK